MTKRNNNDTQLEAGRAVALTNESKLSLYKKSQKSGISTDILEEVYRRGFVSWSEELGGTPQQFAFDRVNSFIADGYAAILDEDLKKACWKGYEAYGMKMKNGKKVPNCVPVKEAETDEKHSTNPDDPASRFVGSSELTGVYMKDTPGQIIKRVCKESSEKLRLSYTNKAMKQTREKEKKSGEHFKREEGIHRAARLMLRDKKKEVKEDVGASATAANAPTASSMGPSKLSRNARVELSRRAPAGGDGLRNLGSNRFSASSPSNLDTSRRYSRSTTATAKTLTPQRASVSTPTPKTASAPTSTPKPSASFGSSSRPTTVRATSGSLEKSGGYKLSSGMSDAGKVKVRPEAPAEVIAGVAKKGLGAAVRSAVKGGIAGAAMDMAAQELSKKAQASYKAGHQSFTPHGAEGEKASTVFNRMKDKPQGRSISKYENDVLTPKNPPKAEAPKAANPVVNAPLPPTRPDHFTRGQAFKDARTQAGGGEGKFTYNNKSYQTNVKGEKFKPASTLKPTNVND